MKKGRTFALWGFSSPASSNRPWHLSNRSRHSPKAKGRVHSSNFSQMPCKKCEQVQGVQGRKKILLIQPETGRTHLAISSRANCILGMCTHNLSTQRGGQVCIHSHATWPKCALCKWHLDTFLKCSEVLLGVLLGLSLIAFVYQNKTCLASAPS